MVNDRLSWESEYKINVSLEYKDRDGRTTDI